MSASSNTNKTHIQNNIQFLEEQLIGLDHYLPETYEYLIRQLDLQRRTLTELEVQEHFNRPQDTNDRLEAISVKTAIGNLNS
jgi:hypothetical protein